MKQINQIKLNINHSKRDLLDKVAKILHIKVSDIYETKFRILRKSIDARDKNDIKYVYNVAVDYEEKDEFNPIIADVNKIKINDKRPIVVGFGPAGIFAAYIFAINGFRPIILERGKPLDDRINDVEKFLKTLELDEDSNVSFGEGGAGAFSDGKLNTNNKDKDGIYRFILKTFVKYGADPSILYENLPHVGTDKLVDIIKNMRDEILKQGGEIKYSTKFTYDEYKNYAKDGAPIILAIGNSSRDTFRDLINNGFDIKPKPIAIGFRIAHKQKMINEAQYGINASLLPPATYKLTYDVKNGHSVYSFCMCPGGYIINSSNFKGYLSINGMSYSDRSGIYANSAIVETITVDDAKIIYNKSSVGSKEGNCKKIDKVARDLMIDLQEKIEKKSYLLENGFIPYCFPTGKEENTIFHKDLKESDIFKGLAKYSEKVFDIYEDIGLDFSIKNDITSALIHFNKIIPGFYDDKESIIIAGVETRTSSPVSLFRDENFMCNVKNFYPCGEGLGHGGGIMSSAADGVYVAMKIVKMM